MTEAKTKHGVVHHHEALLGLVLQILLCTHPSVEKVNSCFLFSYFTVQTWRCLFFSTFTLLIFPVVKFQTSMNPSTEPVIKYLPSGEKRAHSTCDLRPNCGSELWHSVNTLCCCWWPKKSAHSSAYAACEAGLLGNQAQNDVRQPRGGVRFSTTLHSKVVWADRLHLGPRKARASNTGSSIWTQVMKAQPETKDKSPQGSEAIRGEGPCACAVCACVHVHQWQYFVISIFMWWTC